MAPRRNQGPQPSLAPFVLLGGLVVAGGAIAYGYPGILAIWASFVAAAWMEPVAVLTGKRNASGSPTAAHPGERKALSRYEFWRDMKFRMLLPNSDWICGWPVLGSWLAAVLTAAVCWFVPVRTPELRWVDAAAGFIVVAQCAGSWRRTAEDGTSPGTRLDSLRTLDRVQMLVWGLAGLVLGAALSAATIIGLARLPRHLSRFQIVAPNVFCALLVIGSVLAALSVPWMRAALAEWRELVAVRQSWEPRWMALKKDPAPYLVEHKMVGPMSVDTFQADPSEGALAYWSIAPKLTPTVGAGMVVAVLECTDENAQGPIPGSRHPLRFDVVSWPSDALPSLADPDVGQDVAELVMRCSFNATLAEAGYGLPVLIGSQRVSVEAETQEPPKLTWRQRLSAKKESTGQASDRVAAAIAGDPTAPAGGGAPDKHDHDGDGHDEEETAPARSGSPTSAWASAWAWPSGPDLAAVRSFAPAIGARAGVEVLIDHRKDVVYFGALTDEATEWVEDNYPQVMRNLIVDDKWTVIWGQVMKAKTNPPTAQHGITADATLADGTVVHRMAFMSRQGMDPAEFRGLEGKLATALSAAPFVAITGYQGPGKRAGERHPQAFALYWSDKPVPSGPDTLPPSEASTWVLRGRINAAFEASRLARPEISAAAALTRPRSTTGHIWRIDLRLYGGVTLADVRGAAARLRGSMGVPWLRVTESEDGCTIYAGVERTRARLLEPARDEMRLISLDWEQAWGDAGVRGSGGLLPVLVDSTAMPKNTDVKVLTFSLPPGLELLQLREATKKLSTATGNEYVEVRPSDRGPKFAKVLCCLTNPMPSMVAYDFDNPRDSGKIVFATGIDGDPIAWSRKSDAHLLYAGTSGSGKLMPLDSRLPVPVCDRFPDGWATVGTLAVGDHVLAADGSEATVYGLSPIDTTEVFEVVLSDGQVIECGPEHLWRVSSAAARHTWAPREVTVGDANTTAARRKADQIREVAAAIDPGTVATLDQIAALVDVSLAEICRVGQALDHLAVPIFVPTTERTATYDISAVLDYMAGVADRRGACRVFGMDYDRQVIDGLTLRGEWLSMRDFASALLGREATHLEVSSIESVFQRCNPARRADGVSRMLTSAYPVGELLELVADRIESYLGNGSESMPLMSVVSTREMFADQRTCDARNESNYAVAVPSAYDPPAADLPVEPYMLGVWLGGGDTAGGRITSCTTEACTDTDGRTDGLTDQAYLIEQLAMAGYEATRVAHDPERVLRVHGLTANLRPLGVLGNKHIPAAYLRASAKQRLALLQGLMDTGGSIDVNGSCELTLCRQRLAADALELIRSLGIRASMRTSDAAIGRAGVRRVAGTHWHIDFTTVEQVFTLPRKVARLKTELRPTQQWTHVVEVRRTGRMAPMRCLMVDSSEHTYLTGGFVPTHNSAGAQNLLYGALMDGCDVVVIDPTKGAADFAFLKPYARAIIGIDTEKDLAFHLIDAAATMKAIYAEGLRRRKLNASHGVGSYLDLPESIRPKPLIVMIDEFVGLIGQDKVQRTPFDDPDMEYERQVQIATNTAKVMVGQMTSKIAAEARAWGIHLILGTQKLPASLLDGIPNGATLKTNLARILLGKTTQGDRMSALRNYEDYPEMGDNIGKGRGAWEPTDSPAVMIQTWFATQPQYAAALSDRVAPLDAAAILDPTPFRIPLPQRDVDEGDGFGDFFADDLVEEQEAAPEVVVLDKMSFSLDDLDEALIDDDPVDSDSDPVVTVVPEGPGPHRADPVATAPSDVETAPAGDVEVVADEPVTEQAPPLLRSAAIDPALTDCAVFLDVDGVLAPLYGQPAAWPDWSPNNGTPNGTILTSPSMLAAISGLHAPMVWLSDWGHDADVQFGERLGWVGMPVAEHPGDGDYWWKIDALLGYLDSRPDIHRVVWVDDMLGEQDEIGIAHADLVAEMLDDRGVAHLLVDTAATDCLSPQAVEDIRRWLGAASQPADSAPERAHTAPAASSPVPPTPMPSGPVAAPTPAPEPEPEPEPTAPMVEPEPEPTAPMVEPSTANQDPAPRPAPSRAADDDDEFAPVFRVPYTGVSGQDDDIFA